MEDIMSSILFSGTSMNNSTEILDVDTQSIAIGHNSLDKIIAFFCAKSRYKRQNIDDMKSEEPTLLFFWLWSQRTTLVIF